MAAMPGASSVPRATRQISVAVSDTASARANLAGSSNRNGRLPGRMCCGDARNSACTWTPTHPGPSLRCSPAAAPLKNTVFAELETVTAAAVAEDRQPQMGALMADRDCLVWL